MVKEHSSEILKSSIGERFWQFCASVYIAVHRSRVLGSVSVGLGEKDLPEKVKSKLRTEERLEGTLLGHVRHCTGMDACVIIIH